MNDEGFSIPSDFRNIVNKGKEQQGEKEPLDFYSEEMLEYILEKLHVATRKYEGLVISGIDGR